MFYHWIWYNPSVQAHHAELKDVVLEGVALLLLLLHYSDFLAGSVHLMVDILRITYIYILIIFICLATVCFSQKLQEFSLDWFGYILSFNNERKVVIVVVEVVCLF